MERDPSSSATRVAPQLFTLIFNSTRISYCPKGSCGAHKLPAELLSEEGSRGPQMPAYPSTNSRTLRGLLFHVHRSSQTAPNSYSKSLTCLSLLCVGMSVQALRPSRSISPYLLSNSSPGSEPHSLQRGSLCSHVPSQSTDPAF